MNKATRKLINLSRFFGDFTPIVPYMAVFFARQGVSVPQISLLFSVWAGTIVLLEIPTGILADRVDRKSILILSRLTKLGCFVAWLVSPTFAGFLLGFILWGLASALDSGAFQAFMYDHADTAGAAEDALVSVFGQAFGWSFAGLFLSALLAAALVSWGFVPLLLLAIISLALSIVFLIQVPRPALPEPRIETAATRGMFRRSAVYIWSRPILIHLMIIGIAAGGVKGSLEEYYPLLFETKGVALALIGIIIAGFELVKSAGGMAAGYFKSLEHRQPLLLGVIGVLAVLSGVLPGYYPIVFLLLLTFVDVLLWAMNDAAIQRAATHRNRATIASLKNFGIEASAFAVFLLFNVVTRQTSLGGAYAA
ncbi:MAG: hypothetical protein COT71_01990 [Candidatus Andersenbacteria bacterium CG10_big_fil_rev_8_21_14_0_10_54_11]|uniref:Major facilitator superfamily (MFS) profile domain-containing protein n=1 Tax=Candidatus Andersenbacteria bacterium CG10_big_fil_rev_8_21_14_0_10_54_11 TaxID=1974485 RepID=A0A2M6WZN2_9BACT|nr:MAG: hypothetical protein COT71_01990 [Candidatus Andersenbacteria bacterium CG10_big_fil_rev_8_21_14_0_10_54_11]